MRLCHPLDDEDPAGASGMLRTRESSVRNKNEYNYIHAGALVCAINADKKKKKNLQTRV